MTASTLASLNQLVPLDLPGRRSLDSFVASFKPGAAIIIAGSSPLIRTTLPAAGEVPTPYSKTIHAARQSKNEAGAALDGPFVYAIGDGAKAEINLPHILSTVAALPRWGGDHGKSNLAYLAKHGVVAIKVADGEHGLFSSQHVSMDKYSPPALLETVEQPSGSKVWAREASCAQILHQDGGVSHHVVAPAHDPLTGISHARRMTAGKLSEDYSLATRALCAAAADKLGLPLPAGCKMSAGEAEKLMREAGMELVLLRNLLPAPPGQAFSAAKTSFERGLG